MNLDKVDKWAFQWKKEFNPDPKSIQKKLFFLKN